MKHLPVIIALFVISVAPSLLNASESNTAEFLYADPYTHLDQQVLVKVVSVHPEHFESVVRDVVWFKAQTATPSTKDGHAYLKPGGEIMVAVDSSSSGSFYHTYGDEHSVHSSGYVPLHSLSGTFRAFDRLLKADPNTRRVDNVKINNGAYFIDVTTSDQFKNVEGPSPSPSPSPSANTDASTSQGSTHSTWFGDIKGFLNKFSGNH